MKQIIMCLTLLISIINSLIVSAQDDKFEYHRSSLYSFCIVNPETLFADDIAAVFKQIPLPDKFNNHNLKRKIVNSKYCIEGKKPKDSKPTTTEFFSSIGISPKDFLILYHPIIGKIITKNRNNLDTTMTKSLSEDKKEDKKEDEKEDKKEDKKQNYKVKAMTEFVNSNNLGNKLVAKWFNMDKNNGTCNMDLVQQRGYYDANALSTKLSDLTVRGRKMLADAGEDLISQTFVVANYIRYSDKKEKAAVWNAVFQTAKLVGDIGVEYGAGSSFGIIQSVGDLGNTITKDWDGFKVIVDTYLFQLDWNDDNSVTFYKTYYKTQNDEENFENFDKSKLFNLKYVGNTKVKSGKTSIIGVKDRVAFMRKVCTRAIDKSLVKLQKEYEDFRVKTPLVSVDPITAYIGKKEGLTKDSKFEVLEVGEDEEGRTTYKRVGVVKPQGKIWDNQYMASEENAVGSDLQFTTFKKVSGGNFYPGMLLREIK